MTDRVKTTRQGARKNCLLFFSFFILLVSILSIGKEKQAVDVGDDACEKA